MGQTSEKHGKTHQIYEVGRLERNSIRLPEHGTVSPGVLKIVFRVRQVQTAAVLVPNISFGMSAGNVLNEYQKEYIVFMPGNHVGHRSNSVNNKASCTPVILGRRKLNDADNT